MRGAGRLCVGSLLALALLAAADAPAQLATPTPASDCCRGHEQGGCDDVGCQTCVCAIEASCCSAAWDDLLCAAAARDGLACADACAVLCQASAEETSTPTPTPTEMPPTPTDAVPTATPAPPTMTEVPPTTTPTTDPSTPTRTATSTRTRTPTRTNSGTPTMTGTRTLTGTRTATGTPTAAGGTCCDEHLGIGCAVASCQNCVCDTDPLCCDPDTGWDSFCVDRANSDCASKCPCEGPTPTPTPGGDPCCNAHLGGGCGNLDCEACVCGVDAFCCSNGWDPSCVESAQGACAADCHCSPPQPTPTRTRTPTATVPSATPTSTRTRTPTASRTVTPEASLTPSPPATPAASATSVPTETPPPSVSPTDGASPTPTARLDADLDGDGMIDDGDLRVIVRDIFSAPEDLRADLNADGRVSSGDLAAFSMAVAAPSSPAE